MAENKTIRELDYYVLLVLRNPMNAIDTAKAIEKASKGSVKVFPGSLYNSMKSLNDKGKITSVPDENGTRIFSLTEHGEKMLEDYLSVIASMTENGKASKEGAEQ